MIKKLLLPIILTFVLTNTYSQALNWHLSAQAGTADYHFENFQGAFLAGFKNYDGQQLSFGPIFKGYNLNSDNHNFMGARIYSQAKIYQGVSMYLQCDIFDGIRSKIGAPSKSPMRLETGAGIIYTYKERVGLSAGYNFGEYNPVNRFRKNTPSIKLIYLMPLSKAY
ncbi:MAG TPA: hypothetical protein VGB63_06790 [Pedobacter sp.]|jgi:hypothetical protein